MPRKQRNHTKINAGKCAPRKNEKKNLFCVIVAVAHGHRRIGRYIAIECPSHGIDHLFFLCPSSLVCFPVAQPYPDGRGWACNEASEGLLYPFATVGTALHMCVLGALFRLKAHSQREAA